MRSEIPYKARDQHPPDSHSVHFLVSFRLPRIQGGSDVLDL